MRILLPITLSSAFLFLFVSLRTKERSFVKDEAAVIGCAPPGSYEIQPAADGRYSPVFPGWGRYSHKVITGDDSTQFFFDQGLNMYYSYHLPEALASFKEAARRDSACVMAWWGQALAMGPYYNSYVYKMPATVLTVLVQMNRVASSAKGEEKDLVEAMNKRYSADTSDGKRMELNRSYADGLAGLLKKYPEDPDIKALYIDAVMLEHVWDFWTSGGQPKAWTSELVSYCDEILHVYPTHPAALHYEIHLVEASLHPEKALHNADVLQASMPGVSHMVHMSSHMYQRNGLYAKGVEVNERATVLQLGYDSMAPNLKIGSFVLSHFEGVGSFCAMNANMYGKGWQASRALRKLLSTTYRSRLSINFFQYLYMMPMFVDIRSGKWKEVMEDPAPDSSLHNALLLYEFGKGMGCAHLGDRTGALRHLDSLRLLMKDGSLAIRTMPFNAPLESAKVAEGILAGELLLSEGKTGEGIRSLEEAVSVEDKMIYREPRDWPIPVRHFLGAALLKLNRAEEAEKVYRQDLALNQGNGWSLLGLCQSLRVQHKEEAGQYEKAYKKAFAAAEVAPPASVY